MEKEKEKSSRKHRDSDHYDREKVRESAKDSKDRDHHRHHRNSKEKSRDVDDEVHRHRSDRRSVREYSVEREKSVDYSRNEREGSRDRHKREKSHDREDSVERRHGKRKERGPSEEDGYVDGGTKRARVVEERRERKRFEEDADENGMGEEKKEKRRFEDAGEDKDNREERKEKMRFDDSSRDKDNREERKEKMRFDDSSRDKDNREERKEKRKFEDRVKKEKGFEAEKERAEARIFKKEPKEEPVHNSFGDMNCGGSSVHVGALELPTTASRTSIDVPLSENRSPATKVSSISNTNENTGVNSNRSHEVPGKSSTDGTGSDAGKKKFSADALSTAKRTLRMGNKLAEKLKNFQLLKKDGGPTKEGSPHVAGKEELKILSTSSGLLPPPAPSGSSSSATAVNAPQSGLPHLAGLTTQKYEAVKRAQELAAKMGFRQDPEFAPLINMFPGQLQPDVSVQPKPAKAPVLRLDALGREIDEYGNVINIPKVNNLSTLKVNINKQKKDAFQILKPELEVDPEKNPHFDASMGIDKNKLLRPKRMNFQFVEEGKWSKDAEIIKLKSQFGEARTKELKAKQAQLAKAKSEPDINPNLIEVSERVSTKEKPKEQIPEIEWWDVPVLLSGNYSGVIDGNLTEDKLKLEKITIYVEHPRPIEPPAEPVPPPPQPLKLTKKEQKKLRTQRRLAREKDKQEMIRQGLIEPPKPKVKMSNLMRVLGSEATQDPTKLEMEIRSAAADREQAHIDRNIARKLTPAERREKKERKLFDDSSNPETIVSVYKINNLSHPQARFKVDANAHENRLTGSAVISEGISVVVVEGCPKSIKRYGKLMLRRIDWAAAVKKEEGEDDEGDDAHDAPVNKCLLVWQGNVAKPNFNRFSVHECRTEAAARKIFSDAGVAHYWELAVNFTEDQM